MSLSEGEDHPADYVLDILGPKEPYLYRLDPLDHERKESPFRIVWWTSRFAPILAPVLVLALSLIQAFSNSESVASMISTPTIVYFCRMYGIPDHIKISTPSPNDRVISGPKGGNAISRHSSRRVFVYPFISSSSYYLIDTALSLLS